jgi:hypothetical protein
MTLVFEALIILRIDITHALLRLLYYGYSGRFITHATVMNFENMFDDV